MAKKHTNAQKKFSIRKIIAKSMEATLLVGFSASTVWTAVEGVKEIVETEKGDNKVIDFDYGLFSIVFKHNETRNLEQLIADVENVILEVENIDKAFSEPQNLTKQQKEKIIQDIINAMSKEADLNTNQFRLEKIGNRNGYYFSIYNRAMSIVTKKIIINKSFMENQFDEVIWGTIHEMTHAILNENYLRSDNVSKVDKKAFFSKAIANQQKNMDYVSSFHEILPQLFAARLQTYFEVNYGNSLFGSEIENGVEKAILREFIYNLYGLKAGINFNFNFPPQEHINVFQLDEKDYKMLTVKELTKLAIAQKFDEAKVSYTSDDLENSVYFKILDHYFEEEIMNVRYVDYMHKNYDLKIVDVSREIIRFESYVIKASEANKNSTIAEHIATYVNIFRYKADEYNSQDKLLLSNVIFKYLDDIPENYIKSFGLQDASEIMSEHISQLNNEDLEEITL